MTALEKLLSTLKELESKATPGPWAKRGNELWSWQGGFMCSMLNEVDLWIVAEGRDALPTLLKIIETQAEALKELHPNDWVCNTCDGPGVAKRAIQKCEELAGGE